ncbi:MAG: ABC transporter substrate-binding protein [Pseudonocardia sp.]
MSSRSPRIGAVLSLSGRFARFGRQAAAGLRAWARLAAEGDVVVVDDGSDPARVPDALRDLAARCDLLLGPYSTLLARQAAAFARHDDRLVWNHGGSGDDVQEAAPGRLVSVLSPTSRYADRFVAHLAEHWSALPLQLVAGRGAFARQVIDGARESAHRLGVQITEADGPEPVAVFCAGTFEHDTAVVADLLARDQPPHVIGTVAAGVQDFRDAVPAPRGVFGVAQWTPSGGPPVLLGPTEPAFVDAYGSTPDYPAVQAAATAAVASHCARLAGSTAADDLWAAAVELRTRTLFGEFGVDPVTGAQRAHVMTLVRWTRGRRLERVG